MKLGKDEIQKLALSALLLAGLLYCYFALLLAPLSATEVKARKEMATLEPQIAEAKKQIQKAGQIEKQAPASQALLAGLKSRIPEGAPIAWFPPRIADFFKRQGIDRAMTRYNAESLEKDLPGFRRLTWAVDLPKVEFVSLGAALAALENEEPLLQVTTVSVEANKDEPQYQHATLVVATIVQQ